MYAWIAVVLGIIAFVFRLSGTVLFSHLDYEALFLAAFVFASTHLALTLPWYPARWRRPPP